MSILEKVDPKQIDTKQTGPMLPRSIVDNLATTVAVTHPDVHVASYMLGLQHGAMAHHVAMKQIIAKNQSGPGGKAKTPAPIVRGS